jgi:hypothetical protein
MRPAHLLLFSLLSCAIACNKTAPTRGEPASADTASPMTMSEDACPVHVPATTVTVVNTKDGVAMFFTTTAANVSEVRKRVAAIAKMEVSGEAEPADAHPSVDMPPYMMGAAPELVPLRAVAEDVSDGASLTLTPLNPMDVEPLRAYALSQSYRMRLGRCDPDFMKPPHATGPQNAAQPDETLGREPASSAPQAHTVS